MRAGNRKIGKRQDANPWEGRCNPLAGREAKGRQPLCRFVELAESDPRYDRLTRTAVEHLRDRPRA